MLACSFCSRRTLLSLCSRTGSADSSAAGDVPPAWSVNGTSCVMTSLTARTATNNSSPTPASPARLPSPPTTRSVSEAALRKNICGRPGPSSFGRQQRLSEITIEPTRYAQRAQTSAEHGNPEDPDFGLWTPGSEA